MNFFQMYQQLKDRDDKQDFRNKIVSACSIQQSTYYSWLRRKIIPRKAKEIISELLNISQNELFPKDNLSN